MAIIIRGKTKCSLCGKVLNDADEIVATQAFIQDRNNPLWRYSDSAMHKPCFFIWNKKEEFISMYNETLGKIVWDNGTSYYMKLDGTISVQLHGD